jgi:PadR family transcriptional regulator PadR
MFLGLKGALLPGKGALFVPLFCGLRRWSGSLLKWVFSDADCIMRLCCIIQRKRFGSNRLVCGGSWNRPVFRRPQRRQSAERARHHSCGHCIGKDVNFFAVSKGAAVATDKSEVLQGTLDLMILKTLQALGSLHGFGIARRIEQLSEDVLTLNEGTVYTSLLRLQQKSWIASEWGVSENNRRARFYSITKRGLKQLEVETENWERISAVIGRVLALEAKA